MLLLPARRTYDGTREVVDDPDGLLDKEARAFQEDDFKNVTAHRRRDRRWSATTCWVLPRYSPPPHFFQDTQGSPFALHFNRGGAAIQHLWPMVLTITGPYRLLWRRFLGLLLRNQLRQLVRLHPSIELPLELP